MLSFLWTFYRKLKKNEHISVPTAPKAKEHVSCLCSLLSNDRLLLFSIRTPRKQSNSCPFFSGQAALRLWWSMSSVALASSSIYLRRPASSPSCWRVSSMSHMSLWEVDPGLFPVASSPPVFPPFHQAYDFGK